MKPFLCIVAREIRERRLLLAMSALVGLFPLTTPLFPGIRPDAIAEARVATALGLALFLSATFAFLLGASAIAGELGAGRMSFFFNRPLSGRSIWAGKMAALLLVACGSAGLVCLPALLAAPSSFRAGLRTIASDQNWNLGFGAVLWLLGLIAVLAFSHAFSIAVRARSIWAALDVAALAMVGGGVIAIWRWLDYQGLPVLAFSPRTLRASWTITTWVLSGLALVIVVALLIAGAVQVVHGRTDLRRGHRLLSLTLWSILGCALLALFGVSRWMVAVTPDDLTSLLTVASAPGGPWLATEGTVRHRPGFYPTFLIDTASGRSLRLRASSPAVFAPAVVFDPLGRWAAWFSAAGIPGRSPYELTTLDLTDPGAEPRATGAFFFPQYSEVFYLALAPDGRRFALLSGQQLQVEDLREHRLLASIRLDGDPYAAKVLSFDGPESVRVDRLNQYTSGPLIAPYGRTEVTLDRIDLTTRKLIPGPTVSPRTFTSGYWLRSAEEDRGIFKGHDRLEVWDADQGTPLGAVQGKQLEVRPVPGGVVTWQWTGADTLSGRTVRLFDRDGMVERGRLALPGVVAVAVYGGDPGGRPQLLARGPAKDHPRPVATWRRWEIDVAASAFRPLPPVRLVQLSVKTPWSSRRIREADGLVCAPYPNGPLQVVLHPKR